MVAATGSRGTPARASRREQHDNPGRCCSDHSHGDGEPPAERLRPVEGSPRPTRSADRRQFASKLENVDLPDDPFQVYASPIEIPDSLKLARKMYHAVGRDYLTGLGEPAKTCRHVEGGSSEAAVDPDRLPRIDSDPNVERQVGIGATFFFEAHLKLNGRSKGLAGRPEDGERLVSAQLDDRTAASTDTFTGD
jgi:hypothetical protein